MCWNTMFLSVIDIAYAMVVGIFSGGLVYYYSFIRDKKRSVLSYAQETADKADYIYQEALKCSQSDSEKVSIYELSRLINTSVRRRFIGDIIDKTRESRALQEDIKNTNEAVTKIENIVDVALDSGGHLNCSDKTELLTLAYQLNDELLSLWGSMQKYKRAEDLLISKWQKIIIWAGSIFIIILTTLKLVL